MIDRPAGIGPGLERRRILVRGVVQGVGFRPFVFRLAQEMDLSGWVRSDREGVEIEVQGLRGNVSALLARLVGEAPPLARVDSVMSRLGTPDPADRGFTIQASSTGAVTTAIGHDTSVCPSCLAEMFDPDDRRWRFPFINCTHCGPRYTITRAQPYDRANTSMARFALCPSCQVEYDSPGDRRFHAEPNACPACGPRLALLEAAGVRIATRDPIADLLLRLLTGEIVAIKGLGGFHLVCNARNPEAVERLRACKGRDDKPFAIMVANLASAREWAFLTRTEEQLLASPERPIVLTEKRPSVDHELWGVAPGLSTIGLILPYTPIHYLLFHDDAGRPAGTTWLDSPHELALAVTSANPGGEPLVIDNGEAVRRLAGIADAFLIHDRDILLRTDDSVVIAEHQPYADRRQGFRFVRRGRGFTPRAIRLPGKGPAVIGLGAWLKNAVCIARGDEAFLSQHIGDLDSAATCLAMDEAVEHLMATLAIRPEMVAHDLHPDFHSTRAAQALSERFDIPALAVQHHHAHAAAVLAEHGHREAALGIALDGVGLGTDGTAWGGEMLLVEDAGFERLGHLAPLALPGGDRATREPWRLAAAVLHRLGRSGEIAERFGHQRGADNLRPLLDRPYLSPPTTSLGRWFDALAGLLGICETVGFEGEAAMRLESLAQHYGPVIAHTGGWTESDGVLDLLPICERLMREPDHARAAAVFHATLVAALDEWIGRAARRTGLRTVALCGGCLVNRALAHDLPQRLSARGLKVLTARQAPTGDGGIALGQAWVAIRHATTGA